MNAQRLISNTAPVWTFHPKTQNMNYRFAGLGRMTQLVHTSFQAIELTILVSMLKTAIKETGGLDRIQEFTHRDGRKVWVVDHLTQQELKAFNYSNEEVRANNYFTMIMPEGN